jgi:hypothetical protein
LEPAHGRAEAGANIRRQAGNYHWRARRSGDAGLLGKWSSGSGSRGTVGSAGPVRGSCEPTETPQLRDTVPDPKPTPRPARPSGSPSAFNARAGSTQRRLVTATGPRQSGPTLWRGVLAAAPRWPHHRGLRRPGRIVRLRIPTAKEMIGGQLRALLENWALTGLPQLAGISGLDDDGAFF